MKISCGLVVVVAALMVVPLGSGWGMTPSRALASGGAVAADGAAAPVSAPPRLDTVGALAGWSSTTNYPIDVEGGSCVVSSGYEYCVGGTTDDAGSYAAGTATDAVYYAPISSAGIGTWNGTSSYPTAVDLESCVSSSGYVYCVGGGSGYSTGPFTSVYYAQLSASGVSAWESTTSYPGGGMQDGSCVASGGYIYCIGGSYSDAVYYAPLSSAGVGSWASTTAYPEGLNGLACVTLSGYVYCLAGVTPSSGNSTEYYAPISSAGVGAWVQTTNFSWSIDGFGITAVVLSGLVYTIGGCVGPQPGCFTAAVNYSELSSGGLGPWSSTTPLPAATYDDCVASGEYIYCLTGGPAYYTHLPAYNVTFTETGLPVGAFFSVTVNGTTESSPTGSVTFEEPNGTFPFSVGEVTGFTASPESGTVAVNGAAVSVAIKFTASEAPWAYGWDTFSGPLNFGLSNVTWDQPTASSLDVTYNFVGADPDTEYTPGLALFWATGSQCVSSFGQFALGPCGEVTRQGVTTWEEDTNNCLCQSIGSFTTNSSGDGSFYVDVVGLHAGNYTLEFYVNFLTESGGSDHNVNFQSPGPFGTGVNLSFGLTTYSVTFTESGLTSGVPWAVTYNGSTSTSASSTIVFGEPNGSYAFAVGGIPGWSVNPSSGALAVSGGPTGLTIVFLPVESITVGASPGTPLYAAGQVYVPNNASGTVSVISGSANRVLENLSVGANPETPAFDPATGEVFVSNFGSDNVSVINTTTDAVVATVAVGSAPLAPVYDPEDGAVYVSDEGSNTTSVISGTTDLLEATVPVGYAPQSPAVDTANGDVYVPNPGSNNVSVIDGTNFSVGATIPVGTEPVTPVYDPSNGDVYVPNYGSSNVSVISSATNTVVATIPVGELPFAPAVGEAAGPLIFSRSTLPHGPPLFVVANGDVYVVDADSATVSVISGTSNSVVATIAVGSNPQAPVLDPATDNVYVANAGSGNLSVISAANNSPVASIPTGPDPGPPALDNETGTLYVPDSGSDSVTVVVGDFYITFEATGLPSGAVWRVAVTPVTSSAVGTGGLFSRTTAPFGVPAGTYDYVIVGPKGYRVTGTTAPAGTLGVSSSDLIESVRFVRGATYSVTFHETGLPKGVVWCATLGFSPCSSTASVTVANLTPWTYPYSVLSVVGFESTVVPGGKNYAASPDEEVNVTSHSVTVRVKFAARTYALTFSESGLPAGKSWSVHLAYTFYGKQFSKVVRTTSSSITIDLPNDTFAYTVGKVKGYGASPAEGTVSLTGVPNAVEITFGKLPGHDSAPDAGIGPVRGYGEAGATAGRADLTRPLRIGRV